MGTVYLRFFIIKLCAVVSNFDRISTDVIDRYEAANEANESNFSEDVYWLISQIEIVIRCGVSIGSPCHMV